MHREIAGKLTSPITKWVMLAFWVAVFVVSLAPSQKLGDVQKNDAINWLPGSAESTQAFKKMDAFQDPNAIPTIIVYERTSGITQDDLAKAKADAQAFTTLQGVDGPQSVQGPIPSQDGQALQTVVQLNLGSNGWQKAVDIVNDMKSMGAMTGILPDRFSSLACTESSEAAPSA